MRQFNQYILCRYHALFLFHFTVFSRNKEELLNLSEGISGGHISLDNEIIRKEIIHQLSFVEDVLDYYCLYKYDRSIEQFSNLASGCNAVGFFSSSSILMGILSSADKSGSSWYAIGFISHFTTMLLSLYLKEEVKVDQQWLAQLLLCYRSSLLRMILILNHYVAQAHEYHPDANIEDTRRILKETEDLLEKYDKHLDAKQIGTWLQYQVKEDANMQMEAAMALFAVPSVAISTKYAWNRPTVYNQQLMKKRVILNALRKLRRFR